MKLSTMFQLTDDLGGWSWAMRVQGRIEGGKEEDCQETQAIYGSWEVTLAWEVCSQDVPLNVLNKKDRNSDNSKTPNFP